MIINSFRKYKSRNSVVVEAFVKSDYEKQSTKVFYKFDKRYFNSIEDSILPFAATFLLPAMKLREDLVLGQKITRKFYNNLIKIMNLIESWDIGLNRIQITHDGYVGTVQNKVKKGKYDSASFFSLGVDSFYTYLKHLKSANPIKNLIFVHGFDIPYANKPFYDKAMNNLKKIEKTEKVSVISVSTNLKDVTDKYIDWDWEHGAAMASISILLSNTIDTVYFAGSDSWIQRKKIMPYGTHPKLDPLWSTERIKTIHDGNESTRFQKIKNIVSKSELALKYLRVCNQNLKGVYNCSNCEKCLRTMIDLQICGVLGEAKTFKSKIPLDRLRSIHNEDFDTKVYFEDSLNELKKLNIYPDLQEAISTSLYLSNNPTYLTKLTKFISMLDRKYNKKRIFNYVFGITKQGDRNLLFKLFVKLSIIR